MSRLFFTVDIGDIQRSKMRYASKSKVPNDKGTEKAWKGSVSQFWDLK